MVDAGQHLEDDRHLPWTTAATVGPEHARATWALAARERLLQAAREYHAVVPVAELADFVQRRSLIRTSQRPQSWVGDVLARVGADCVERGEPLLSSLCVDTRGHVASGYAAVVELHRGERVDDADDHAASERLDCHRVFGASLPPGGGAPERPDRRPARRAAPAASAGAARPAARARRAVEPAPPKVERPVVTCPVHFTVLPASGVCDLCEM